MQVFDKSTYPWPDKVNYVDSANNVVGFDMYANCCESFGHGVFLSIPTSTDEAKADIDLSPYSFVNENPTECLPDADGGGGLAFRIVAEGRPDAYVVIWNHHNGYYSHGFSYWNGEGSL